jgi:hypothetical protein
VGDQTTLRFVLVPERREEIIDPVKLGSVDFAERLLEIAHSRLNRLFGYGFAKEPPSVSGDALIIEQQGGNDWRRGIQAVRLELHESGAMILDSNVTGRTERVNSSDLMGTFRIATEDVEAALATDFRFAAAIYEEVDPYRRHQRFLWNSALSGVGYRTFARNPQPSQSYTMATTERGEPFMAFPEGRPIDRSGIAQPAPEIERAVYTWTRK